MATKRKMDAAPTKKLYQELVTKLRKALKAKKSIGRCSVTLYMNAEDDYLERGAYINVCYNLSRFFQEGRHHPDDIVTNAMNGVIGKYFEESGSGGGFGGRDIGFVERDTERNKRKKSEVKAA